MKHLRPLLLIPALALFGQGCLPSFGQPETPTSAPPVSSAMWAEANGVVALDQWPGRTVIISSLILEQDGWVVIHKDQNGKPGPAIGETYLKAGEHSQVVVNLREATVDDMTYYAMLHRDNGDGKFVISQDEAVQSSVLEGIIMASFRADVEVEGMPPAVLP